MHWPIEEIPDSDHLFRRIHVNDFWPTGELNPGAFRETEMSCDWDKYRTPEQAQHGGKQEARKYAVDKLNEGKVRCIEDQCVIHTPDPNLNNQGHSDVVGEKRSTQVRLEFMELCKIVIPLADDAKN